ncbi:MAG TPA: glycosyltransferase family 9 protein [Ignavibacteriaceae bacterium]|nr:glycosyltransferase family 9 protein [Ignavibacteriaceae bacterium]
MKKKILVYALSGIGDALMFTPALVLMRKHLPDAQIDALVMFSGVKDIYERTGKFDNVFHFEFLKQGVVKSLLFLSKLFRKYTHVINVYPSNRKEYNIIGFLSLAKHRGGVKYLRKDFNNFGFLNTVRIQEKDSFHNVEENMLLVRKMFDIKDYKEYDLLFLLIEEDEQYADNFLIRKNISHSDLLIGFHAGCATMKNHIMRRWEPEKFAELAKRLIVELNAKIILFGGPDEIELNQLISSKVNHNNLFIVDSKNLAQSAALIKKCELMITNDSALMHVSAAMKRKVVAIIGPTNRSYIYPWKTPYKIVSLNLDCSPCFFYSPKPLSCSRSDAQFKCIKELDVNLVFNEAKIFLSE